MTKVCTCETHHVSVAQRKSYNLINIGLMLGACFQATYPSDNSDLEKAGLPHVKSVLLYYVSRLDYLLKLMTDVGSNWQLLLKLLQRATYHLLPISSEEREVLGVGILPSCQYMTNTAL